MNEKETNLNRIWPILGNKHIVNFLEKSIKNEKLGHTYIFLGGEGLGKTTMASFFAKSLLCKSKEKGKFSGPCGTCASCKQLNFKEDEEGEANLETVHGDLHILKKLEDKKNIAVEQVREFIHELSLSSFAGGYKIGIVKNAETLSLGASNALLKTLEEPREKVIIILVARHLETVPETIRSRSQVLDFHPVDTTVIYDNLIEAHNASRSMAKNISRLSLGRPALAMKFFENKEFYDDYLEKAEVFLDCFGRDINTRLASVEKITGAKLAGQEGAKKVASILNIWQGVFRDLLLMSTNNAGLIQHEALATKLKQTSGRINERGLLKIEKMFETSREYLKSNVNAKLVLENIIINI